MLLVPPGASSDPVRVSPAKVPLRLQPSASRAKIPQVSTVTTVYIKTAPTTSATLTIIRPLLKKAVPTFMEAMADIEAAGVIPDVMIEAEVTFEDGRTGTINADLRIWEAPLSDTRVAPAEAAE